MSKTVIDWGPYKLSFRKEGDWGTFCFIKEGAFGVRGLYSLDIRFNEQRMKCHLGKLKEESKPSSKKLRTIELDLLRYFIEKTLFEKGFRTVVGRTNKKLAAAMGGRGWTVSADGLEVTKKLSAINNPKPLLWIREERKLRREARKKLARLPKRKAK